MLAAVLYGPNDIRLENVAEPVCHDDEFIIKLKAVGLCGSDVRTILSGHRSLAYPHIIGHEITGEVVAVGASIKKYKVGDRLYVSPQVPCGKCPSCKRGWISQCSDLRVFGTHFPGGYAEYMVIPRSAMERGQIIPIPEGLSDEEAVMTEPLSSVYAAQENANVTLGDTVAVIGTGPIGCLHIELAKLRGAIKVIAIEQSLERLRMAENYGADHLINSQEEDPVKRIKEITGGWGVEKVISANPSTVAQQQAVFMSCKRGTVVLFGGVPHGKLTELDTNVIHYNMLSILGHYGFDHLQNYKSFNLIASGRLQAKKYVTHELPLSDIKKGIELTQSGEAIKVIIHP